MEHPFSPKGIGSWGSPVAQVEGGVQKHSMSEDPFNNVVELMNFDSYAGWCSSPSAMDQMMACYSFSPLQSIQTGYASFDSISLNEQHVSASFPMVDVDAMGQISPQSSFQQISSHCGFPADSSATDDTEPKRGNGYFQQNRSEMMNSSIDRPPGLTLAERTLRVLSLLKDSSGGGILVQVWVPTKQGDDFILSTCDQPYLFDQMLAGYREVSRGYTFSTEIKPGTSPGLPGRVFVSRVPEWTSNVAYYTKGEYLRVQDAVHHDIRGSIALPIFEDDSYETPCCAVLELVTKKEKANFDIEIEDVCRALKAVNLRSTSSPKLYSQCLSKNQRAALAEITDVLRAVCHAHKLPIALTWIPCSYNERVGDETVRVRVKGRSSNFNEKCILCVEDTASYVNDSAMQGFLLACAGHYLEEGQGLAGKALQSNHPFFFPNVKGYDIGEYPLVHHARKYGLNSAVAIRLRSTYTGDDDYILEFFLPVNMKGSTEQQLLLNNLSSTMQRLCKSLRTVTDAELVSAEASIAGFQKGSNPDFPPMASSGTSGEQFNANSVSAEQIPLHGSSPMTLGPTSRGPREKMGGSPRVADKKKSTSERNVSLSVLQQYFSGSLKDAAKSIGVCPTTLKRICRQHGISRWPSRKINKVNRSLKKIQTVLDSVQGVDGSLKFDPSTGGLVAAASIMQDFDARRTLLSPNTDRLVKSPNSVSQEATTVCLTSSNGDEKYTVKLEEDCYMGGIQLRPPRSLIVPNSYKDNSSISLTNCSDESKSAGLETSAWDFSENLQTGFIIEGRKDLDSKTNSNFVSGCWSSIAAAPADEMDCVMNIDTATEARDGVIEHCQPTSSGMTDSSNGSGSMVHGSSSSSPSSGEQKLTKVPITTGDSGSKISVKATYKDDTVRFKLEPSEGCSKLHEEVAMRFKLQIGTFQLKYLDDEDEWVMLACDSDLQECLDILEFVGSRSVKFLVRDVPCAMGSSGSSSCFMGRASW